MNEFINLKNILAGVSEDQLEDALKAELKAQTDAYNNTPQDELGGLTPNEAFLRNRKKSLLIAMS